MAYSGAFIPHENWKLYQELCNACHTYMITDETNAINGIKLAMGKIQIEIRNYLDQLIIERELREIKVAAEEIEEQAVEWDDLNKLFLRMVVSK